MPIAKATGGFAEHRFTGEIVIEHYDINATFSRFFHKITTKADKLFIRRAGSCDYLFSAKCAQITKADGTIYTKHPSPHTDLKSVLFKKFAIILKTIKNIFLLLVGILIAFDSKEDTLGIKAQKLSQDFISVIFIDV
jgi:hypothetical protein